MMHGAPRTATPAVELAGSTRTAFMVLAAIGVITAAAGAFMSPARMWAGWLVVAYYSLGLGLAGLCFVAIHYTTGSTWSVAIRRIPEALAGTLPYSLALLAILFIVHPQLYGWTTDEAFINGTTKAMAFKRFWLSRPFFLIRAAVYAAVWIGFALAIQKRSRRQDEDGDPRWTRENFRLSAACLVLFGITVTLSSFDWVMSLEYHWFSTIFGVYNFAGLFESGLAAMILIALWLERTGPLRNVLSESHLHDLGKLMFAFSIFWMYIWFSQYMLIWYTDIPEETSYYLLRGGGGWYALFLVNIVLNWVIPFIVLLRRDMKRQRLVIAVVAATILVGRWLDVYLMVFPGVVGGTPTLGLWEIGLTLGGVGAFGLVLAAALQGAPAVPVADPELVESLEYH
jgi:hypothetical protein